MSEALSPLIQQVLDGKTPEAAVEEFAVMKDYEDAGVGNRILGLLQDKSVAVVDVRRSVQEGASVFRLDAVARGRRYSIRVIAKSGEFSEGQIGCRETGYRRGLAEDDIDIVVLQTLLGPNCLAGENAVRYLSKFRPSQGITTNMLGLIWMRLKDREPRSSTVSMILPVSEMYLSVQTLNAGELFRMLCARNQNEELTVPRVRSVETRPGYTPRYAVVTGQYEAASAILLGWKSITVLLEHDKETQDGNLTEAETSINIQGLRTGREGQNAEDQEGRDQGESREDHQKENGQEGRDQESGQKENDQEVVVNNGQMEGRTQEKGTHDE